MEQALAVVFFLIVLVSNAFKKSKQTRQRVQRPKPFPVSEKGSESPNLHGRNTTHFEGYDQPRQNDRGNNGSDNAYSFTHGEDSIEHDHWETDNPSAFGDAWQEGTESHSDERIELNTSSMPSTQNRQGTIDSLLPEWTPQNIVRAFMLQEILGQPRSFKEE